MDEGARVPHFPGQVPVDGYGRGGFRFAGMSHRGSLLCLPSGIWAWPVIAADAITADTLAPVIAEADRIALLVIGTGETRWTPPQDLMLLLAQNGISVETARTGQAANTYNILLDEGRRVAAALIATM